MKSIKSLLLAPIAIALLISATLCADPSGVWVWTRDTPQGKTMTSSLKLTVQDGKLTGSLSSPRGDTPISDATYTDDSVQFSVVRSGKEGTKRVTKYTGKIEGDTIKGTIDMPAWHDGDAKKVDWVAKRSSA